MRLGEGEKKAKRKDMFKHLADLPPGRESNVGERSTEMMRKFEIQRGSGYSWLQWRTEGLEEEARRGEEWEAKRERRQAG